MSVDPAVASTNQPYVFTNDNPLNSTDPSGLVPSAGVQETDKEAAQLGKGYALFEANLFANQATNYEAALTSVMSTLGQQLNTDYWNLEFYGLSSNGARLRRKELKDVALYAESVGNIVNGLANVAWKAYGLYQSNGEAAEADEAVYQAQIDLSNASTTAEVIDAVDTLNTAWGAQEAAYFGYVSDEIELAEAILEVFTK
jgi:hypothetical protein